MIYKTPLRGFLLEYLQMILIIIFFTGRNPKEVKFTMNEEIKLVNIELLISHL